MIWVGPDGMAPQQALPDIKDPACIDPQSSLCPRKFSLPCNMTTEIPSDI